MSGFSDYDLWKLRSDRDAFPETEERQHEAETIQCDLCGQVFPLDAEILDCPTPHCPQEPPATGPIAAERLAQSEGV